MSDSIKEYLDLTGSIEILCEIDPNGTRFTEFDEAISVGHSALDKRLKAAVKLDLLEKEVVTGHPGSSHKYVLTPKGARLQQVLERQGAIEAYRVWRDASHRFENKQEEVKSWVKENPEELEKEDWNKMVRFTRRYGVETGEVPFEPSAFTKFLSEYEGTSDDDLEE